jgi:hypothetical protein
MLKSDLVETDKYSIIILLEQKIAGFYLRYAKSPTLRIVPHSVNDKKLNPK